jgi:hypothetical protein
MNQEVQGGSVGGTSTAIVGDSGSGKTELLVTFADYIWRKYKKITLYYSADLGGCGNRMKARIQKGTVWMWRIKSRDPDDNEQLAMATLARAAQGYWPKEVDPITGKSPQACQLVSQVIHQYNVSCPKCGIQMLKTDSRAEIQNMGDLYCAMDKITVNIRNAVIEHNRYRTPGFENVGAVMYDGLTSMADWPMSDLARRGATPTDAGEKKMVIGSSQAVQSDDMFFGTSSMPHYSFAHLQAESWLRDANEIAGLVHPPIWTALEKKGTESDTRILVFGPDIPGSAKTAKIPQWVGNCLGTTVVTTPRGKEWRLYLTEYRDAPGEPVHLCKTRIAPGSLAEATEFLSDGPTDDHGMPRSGVKAFTKFNLGYYFDLEEEALNKELDDSAAFLGETPGLPSGVYGVSQVEPKELVATERMVQVPMAPIAVAASPPVPSPVPGPVPGPVPSPGLAPPTVTPPPTGPPGVAFHPPGPPGPAQVVVPASTPEPTVQVTPQIPGLIPPPPPVSGVEASENPPPPDPPGNVIPPAGKRPVPPAAAAPRPK